MNRLIQGLVAGLCVVGVALAWSASASAQVVVYRPLVTAPAPLQTYYAPVAPVTSYYAPAPVTTYYAPSAPVTSYYAPTTSYYAPTTSYYPAAAAPVTSYYAPATVGVGRVVYRPNPILRPFHFNAVPYAVAY